MTNSDPPGGAPADPIPPQRVTERTAPPRRSPEQRPPQGNTRDV